MSEDKQDTPTQAVARAETAFAIDSKGRRIEVKRLNALQFYQLAKVLGESSGISLPMDMATIACTVVAINTDKFAFPANERDIQLVIQTLDFHGLAAAGEAMAKLAEGADAEIIAAKN